MVWRSRLPTQAFSRWSSPMWVQTFTSSCQTYHGTWEMPTCNYRVGLFCLIILLMVEYSCPRDCPLGNLPQHTFWDTQEEPYLPAGSRQVAALWGRKRSISSTNSSCFIQHAPVEFCKGHSTWRGLGMGLFLQPVIAVGNGCCCFSISLI